jgi:hypothetical protein
MNIVVGVAAAVAAGSGVGVGVGLADPRTRHRKKASKSTEKPLVHGPALILIFHLNTGQ